ncbi:MAG: BLUF domain-containing protein [Acidobacteriota bacterium]|nr:BLUF domain-containing protein [Acidobacteriota bacterium]MDQ2842766.1 BLUF domain-containing protein [Acidobacteriota bacterium]
MGTNATQEEPLSSVVYVSSGRTQERDHIVEILRVSRINNTRLNITGMLAYKEGNFLQVLEGPTSVLSSVVETIERDNRHSGMIILAKKPIKERLFPNWSMAFRELKDLSEEDASFYNPFLDGSLMDEKFRCQPELCYKLLLTFKQSMR